MNQSRIVEEFLRLIAIPSPSRGERQMADALKETLTALGCQVREDDAGTQIGGTAGNVIALLPGTVGTPVLFAAHMDRVPNGDNICPIIADGKITSDGTTILAADDVSGIASILEGLRLLQESGRPHCDVEIAFTISEEKLLGGSRHLDFGRFRARNAYCMDSPGPTGRIINGAPGKAMLHVDVYGKPAHAGNAPEKGVNALTAAAKILAEIRDGRLDPETTVNWAIISAGNVTNVVCDHVRFTGEARSRDPEKLRAYVEYAKQHCEEVISHTAATHSFSAEFCYDGFTVAPEEEILTTLCGVLNASGIQPIIEAGGGGMDANRFNANGIRSVGVATGYSKNHSAAEELSISDLEKAGQLVCDLILAWSEK